MGFTIHKGVRRSWGEVRNMGLTVYKGAIKGSDFDVEGIQNFGPSRNMEGCFPNASMLQTMMHIRKSRHMYQQADKGEG